MSSTTLEILYNGFTYKVIAESIIYENNDTPAFHSGNYNLEIYMPDGTIKESDFYPESDELFSGDLDEGFADLLSTQLLKISSYDHNIN